MRVPGCQRCDVLDAAQVLGTGDSEVFTSAAHSELGIVPGDSRMLSDYLISHPLL